MWDNQGRLVSFKFIEELLKLQTAEGLSLGNRLKENHVHFGNQIMNVQLAAQVLSRSVAEAIDICRNRLQLPEFAESEGTSNFLRIFNNSFDILNSRHLNHTGYKSTLREENISEVDAFCEDAVEYINSLQILRGKKGKTKQPVVESPNQTGFIGFRACLTNIRQIYEKVKSYVGQDGLKTYALNQDHIELFFGSVRTRLGSNDNPTVLQFRSAYKKLLTYVQLEEAPDGSNCLGNLEKVVVLGVHTKRSLNYINGIQEEKRVREVFSSETEFEQELEDENITEEELSEMIQNFTATTEVGVEYLANDLVQNMKKNIFCEFCSTELITIDENHIHGSSFIIALSQYCEAYIRKKIEMEGGMQYALKMKIDQMALSF
uniref:Transposable element P transposase n=1 Tax=Phlebotomus papatasi TaxID=29031 RepID=A0A1B0DFL1_PHLPP